MGIDAHLFGLFWIMTAQEQDNRWLIVFIVVMLAVVEVLDMTIVSVALQDMKGALSAAPDQITWTITVYGVSAAIVMPMTGLLSARFGRKKLLIFSAYGFTASSFLCGLSTSLVQIVLFRGLQGLFGALLPSLAQATIVHTFNKKELPKAMAIFGVGMMVGPILGPVLGGLITDHMGWRFIFYVNVPIGILGALLATKFLPETPGGERKIDYSGLILLILSVGGLQFVLDKGNEMNWFSSNAILFASALSLISFIAFFYKGCVDREHVVNFQLFKDKNFSIGCFVMLCYCVFFLGTLSWLPLMLELFYNFPNETAGLALMPRGVACLVAIVLSARLVRMVDSRLLIVISVLLYAYGTYLMSGYNLLQGENALLWPNLLQGAAVGFFFVPLNGLAYQSLDKKYFNEASGLFNFFRSMGSSVGVAIFTSIMSTQTQVSWNDMIQNVNPFNPSYVHWAHLMHSAVPGPVATAFLGENVINSQAYMVAFIDGNYLFAFLMLFLIPLIMWMTPSVANGDEIMME